MKKLIRSALALGMMIAATQAAIPDKANPGKSAPDKNAIIVRENAVWRSVQQKKVEQFKQLVSTNVSAVYSDGIMTMPDELKAIPKSAMKTISLSDFKVTFPDAQTAIIGYVAKVERVSEGKSVFTTYNAGSVWQLNKGQWQAIFHGEAKQASAKSAPPPSTPSGAKEVQRPD